MQSCTLLRLMMGLQHLHHRPAHGLGLHMLSYVCIDARLLPLLVMLGEEVGRVLRATGRHQVQVYVRRVGVLWHWVPALSKVIQSLRHRSIVDHAAGPARQQDQAIKEFRDLHSRLVDYDQDRHVHLLAYDPQRPHAELGIGSGEPRGGLVAKEQGGARCDPTGQSHSPALAPGDAAHLRSADEGLRNTRQAEGAQQQVHGRFFDSTSNGAGGVVLERQVELHGLPHRPVLRHHILLAHVGGHTLEEVVPGTAVQEDGPVVASGLLHREHIQQGRLAATARAHDGHELPGREVAAAWSQDRLPTAICLDCCEGHVLECESSRRSRQGRSWDHGIWADDSLKERLCRLVLLVQVLLHLLWTPILMLPRRADACLVALQLIDTEAPAAALLQVLWRP
mmetsp:Transcript_20492/g.43566  ORF Transcript_20492/g.43566 Transcript_20492/m.43566 type:complete len:395 (+) Transcript_20492:1041-2225(+)